MGDFSGDKEKQTCAKNLHEKIAALHDPVPVSSAQEVVQEIAKLFEILPHLARIHFLVHSVGRSAVAECLLNSLFNWAFSYGEQEEGGSSSVDANVIQVLRNSTIVEEDKKEGVLIL